MNQLRAAPMATNTNRICAIRRYTFIRRIDNLHVSAVATGLGAARPLCADVSSTVVELSKAKAEDTNAGIVQTTRSRDCGRDRRTLT